MRALATVLVLVFGVTLGLAVMSWANAYSGEFGTPAAPQSIAANGAFSHFDVQIHNRDRFDTWDAPMAAQHGPACEGPPATHPVYALGGAVFICNDHVMTAANATGYGLVALTPSQLLNCSAGCTVQWDQSTEKMSLRDWPDVWLTPWNDNLTLPFGLGNVDLQGMPRQGLHLDANFSQNSWRVNTIANYNETGLPFDQFFGMDDGITAGVNQAAIRQTFKLTITPGHVKLERLASATASQHTWVDANCSCLLAPDYVVQFAQHSYNPEKDGSGLPATWHWDEFVLTPSQPFTLIHSTLLPGAAVTENNTLVQFVSPASANAYLRFSGVCRVLIDGVMAPRQTFLGHPEHASSYFIPIAQGKESVSVSFAPDGWYHDGIGPGCGAQDFHVWAKVGGSPLPTPTSTPIVPPTATPVVPPTSTLTPAAITAVTFDNLAGQNQALNGQYPTGLIDWGSNKWWLAGPWAPHNTKSISFNNGTGTSRTFAFVTPHVLVSLKAGGVSPSTITLACAGNTNKVQAIPANTLTTITTGWTVPCTTMTVSSTNGWDTNFDDLLVQ